MRLDMRAASLCGVARVSLPWLPLWLALGGTLGCGDREVRFGTPEYWELTPQAREAPRASFVEKQAATEDKLRERSRSLGTVEGDMLGRQYRAWARWSRLVEDDPLATAGVFARWRTALARAKWKRRHAPHSLAELRSWLLERQQESTGSWAPDEAPLWLHIGETARALDALAINERIPELRHRLLVLGIIHDPRQVREILEQALERTEKTPFPDELKALARLLRLRWLTREIVSWDQGWEKELWALCNRSWLDPHSGGFPVRRGMAMDIQATFHLVRGWNRGNEVLSFAPAPQTMMTSLLAVADTLSLFLRPQAAALMVGSLSDQDSLTRGRVCCILKDWCRDDMGLLMEEDADLGSACAAGELLYWAGALGGTTKTWMAALGCSGIFEAENMLNQLRRSVSSAEPDLRCLRVCTMINCASFPDSASGEGAPTLVDG